LTRATVCLKHDPVLRHGKATSNYVLATCGTQPGLAHQVLNTGVIGFIVARRFMAS